MYKLKVKEKEFTIPKANLKWLAYVKSQDLGLDFNCQTDKEVIDFLKTINVTVEEI